MRLKVAVQMDPIERISIRGDSTFALLLAAQERQHDISYYTPDRLALRVAWDDVVGVQREKWTVDPFSAIRKDGFVWSKPPPSASRRGMPSGKVDSGAAARYHRRHSLMPRSYL